MNFWSRLVHYSVLICFVYQTLLPAYGGFEDADTRFEFTRSHGGLNIKLYQQQHLIDDFHYTGQGASSTVVKNNYTLKPYGQDFKLTYVGDDQTKLALKVDLNGTVSFHKASHTGLASYKSWAFKTDGQLINEHNLLFYSLYTRAPTFINTGVVKARRAQFLQNYGFNKGIIHLGDDSPYLELEAYQSYLAAIDRTATPQNQYGVFDDHGVLLTDGKLNIRRLNYVAQGLTDVDQLHLTEGASVTVKKQMTVQNDLTGDADQIHNQGMFTVGRIPANQFTVHTWDNSHGVLFLTQPSTLMPVDSFNNTNGQIFSTSNIDFGSHQRLGSVGLIATEGAIRAAVLNAQDGGSIKEALQDAQLFAKREKIRLLMKILHHTDHYLNTITDHMGYTQQGREYLDHKTETGYVFQKRTTEVEEKTVEIESDLPQQLQKLIWDMMKRKSALEQFKKNLKQNLRHIGKIKGDMHGIMATLTGALASVGLDEGEIAGLFEDQDFRDALLYLVNHDNQSYLPSSSPNNRAFEFISTIATNALRMGQNAIQWVKNNPAEFMDQFCNSVILTKPLLKSKNGFIKIAQLLCIGKKVDIKNLGNSTAFSQPHAANQKIVAPSQPKAVNNNVQTRLFSQRNWHEELGIPKNWKQLPSEKHKGIKFQDPTQYGRKEGNFNEVRIMEGRPESRWENQHVDYIIIKRNGQHYDIKGNIVKRDSPEAHIPLETFKDKIPNLIEKLWK